MREKAATANDGTLRDREAELVAAAQKGDRGAFAMLYEANADRVYRYLLSRMGQQADAEDVTAEVFIRAMNALHTYKPQGVPFVGWLLRIAHNQAVNYFKKQTRRRELPLLDSFNAPDDPAERAIVSIETNEIRHAMGDLTDLQREVITLRFGAQLSIAETAKAMDRTEQATKFLQHSALKALRRIMGAQEVRGHA